MANEKGKAKEVKSQITKQSSFFNQLKQSGKSHIFNWSLIISLVITILLACMVYISKGLKLFNKQIVSVSGDMIGISISALGIILAAVALTAVLYSRRSLHQLVNTEGIMSGLLLPYRFLSLLWTIVGISSFLAQLVQLKFNMTICSIVNFIYCFLIIYAIIYFMYIMSEITQHIITSALVESGD